jgi:hypothetical protein
MTLDVLFNSLGHNIRRPTDSNLISSIQATDSSEAQIQSATTFLESIYGDSDRSRISRTPMSRAQTPMTVNSPIAPPGAFPSSPSRESLSREMERLALSETYQAEVLKGYTLPDSPSPKKKDKWHPPSKVPFWQRLTPKKKTQAKPHVQETTHHVRRPPLPRPSGLPQTPEMSQYLIEPNKDTDYVIMVSMYEVYNDRIFDLLSTPNSAPNAMSTRAGAAIQKGLLRRPLLFKNTELSPDRKVVAGLRKIVCGTYEEAMMVLETGLNERRVAGTGSNSVSSRSHGFFCIDVKRSPHGRHNGRLYVLENWSGGTLSIVDLAGSERARNAKTTGSTLAEAGKINESLMYLGQCLQVQSDCQHDGSKPIVPFRQCKLTELLFSNSFPSSSNPSAAPKAPQKAVMIVTADPQGDFNATSQILRYSALAREVTIPRVPSVTSQIGAPLRSPTVNGHNGRSSPADNYFASPQEIEHLTNSLTRLSEECDALALRLAEEEIKRSEAELRLAVAEEKADDLEAQVREECWAEMEEMLAREKERWRVAWEEERRRGERFLDGKLDIVAGRGAVGGSPIKRSPVKAR